VAWSPTLSAELSLSVMNLAPILGWLLANNIPPAGMLGISQKVERGIEKSIRGALS
jgi:hypothetical protein